MSGLVNQIELGHTLKRIGETLIVDGRGFAHLNSYDSVESATLRAMLLEREKARDDMSADIRLMRCSLQERKAHRHAKA